MLKTYLKKKIMQYTRNSCLERRNNCLDNDILKMIINVSNCKYIFVSTKQVESKNNKLKRFLATIFPVY